MPKKAGEEKARRGKRIQRQDSVRRAQRKTLNDLAATLAEMHNMSLLLMDANGILPPFYGGDYLGDDSEVVPMWGSLRETEDPVLVMLLLRVMPATEPNADLRAMRDDLELTNDLPMSEVLAKALSEDQRKMPGMEDFERLTLTLILGGNQLRPTLGYTQDEMFGHIAEGEPFAVLPVVPVVPVEGEDGATRYDWDALDKFFAHVICAGSPHMLEAAVWDFRLRLAMDEATNFLRGEGLDLAAGTSPLNIDELVGLYDMLVMRTVRLYGSTSPVRATQKQLDFIREENGDLIVRPPLKEAIEPVKTLAKARAELKPEDGEAILHMPGSDPNTLVLWAKLRPYKYFGARVREGHIAFDPRAKRLRPAGFAPASHVEWLMSDHLPAIHRMMHLASLREMLMLSGYVAAQLSDFAGRWPDDMASS